MIRTGTLLTTVALVVAAMMLLGCQSDGGETEPEGPKPLRVGVAPDYAPLIFKDAGELTGVEVDCAKALAESLGRPLELVEFERNRLFTEVETRNVDIIMAGISITPERAQFLDFTDPVVGNVLLAMVRTGDAEKFDSAEEIGNIRSAVGVKRGTTSDLWFKRNISNVPVRHQVSNVSAMEDLVNSRIDVFIDDGHSIAFLARQLDRVEAIMIPLHTEDLGWVVRKGNDELRTEVNGVLRQMKTDGRLRAILERWMPYIDRVDIWRD